MQILKVIPIAASLAVLGASAANAAFINGSSTGLVSPASTITFDEIVLPVNAVLTNQYAGLGVSFSPETIYSPQSTGFGNVQGNDVGNFTSDNVVGPINPTILSFTTVQNAVAFAFDADTTPFTFTALLAGSSVDTGSATVGVSLDDFFGFQGVNFNSIQISQTGAGEGPFWNLDNIQLSNASTTTTVPEPITLSLLAFGLAGLGAMRLRRKRAA